jgi:hypothetical protein
MKQLKNISFTLCLAAALYFIFSFFSEFSIAEQSNVKDCVNSCKNKKQVCFNLNPDRRLCEAQFQECAATCTPSDSSSSPSSSPSPSTEQKSEKEVIPL